MVVFTDPAAEAPEGLSRALADVTVASNHRNLEKSKSQIESRIEFIFQNRVN